MQGSRETGTPNVKWILSAIGSTEFRLFCHVSIKKGQISLFACR